MTKIHYLPYEAAEIVKLCLAAGVPEQAALWFEDGYSVAEVAGSLRTTREKVERRSAFNFEPTSPVRPTAVARARDISADELEAAAQQRFAIQRRGLYGGG